MRYLYLHGFASGARSVKGREMSEGFAARGVSLELVDWNCPSFAALTVSAALEAIEAAAGEEGPVTLVGSSMGGYLSALWASQNPERAARLVLLCPGFDLLSRWPDMMGQEAWERWAREGHVEVRDGAGVLTPLHWGFIEDSRRWPQRPEVGCPTLILHGTQDEVVPVSSSREYAAGRPHVRLIELEADHRMLAVSGRLVEEAIGFLGL
jgi:pimeloyl-ACP methyl ester carboxylesterase